ncbi:MAG: DUF1501 domain-containing protein [Myxococcota bacterium]|nr:DUF1501 domain-containing protein [Myxococcota bacterium]
MSSLQLNRRDLFQRLGLSALALSLPRAAAAEGYEGPLFLSVHAGGGWDPTSFCDPKGRANEMSPDPVNRYFSDEIRSVNRSSPIHWAPMGENDVFFEALYDRLLVVNGIDSSTNNHSTGTRYLNSGQLTEGHPSIGALLTGALAPGLPLAYITNGGYDVTRGIAPRTRIGSLDVINRIARPNEDRDYRYQPEWSLEEIQRLSSIRARRRFEGRMLPTKRSALGDFIQSRSGSNELRRLSENLPDLNSFSTALGRQGAIALAGYRAGVTAAANLSVGGFDTHSDHDNRQMTALNNLSAGLLELWREVERLGLEERVFVMVTSDFGRTPRYNDGNGKDHWSITSALFFGAGVRGNRVVGASDEGVRARAIDPETLDLNPDGVLITPAMIHGSLRAHLGLDQQELSRLFPLEDEPLPLFS